MLSLNETKPINFDETSEKVGKIVKPKRKKNPFRESFISFIVEPLIQDDFQLNLFVDKLKQYKRLINIDVSSSQKFDIKVFGDGSNFIKKGGIIIVRLPKSHTFKVIEKKPVIMHEQVNKKWELKIQTFSNIYGELASLVKYENFSFNDVKKILSSNWTDLNDMEEAKKILNLIKKKRKNRKYETKYTFENFPFFERENLLKDVLSDAENGKNISYIFLTERI